MWILSTFRFEQSFEAVTGTDILRYNLLLFLMCRSYTNVAHVLQLKTFTNVLIGLIFSHFCQGRW